MNRKDATVWEYREERSFDGFEDERKAMLAHLGKDGWELVSVVASPKSLSPMFVFYFKRRVGS